MTKLVIQIPCFNEEATLGTTLADLPRQVPGVDTVEWLIVDDGSRDRTLEVAQAAGVDRIVRHPHNQGLARAFLTGIRSSLQAGADIIVNTDADNQYCAADIPKLIQPILDGRAEIVIGTRPILHIHHFSRAKKLLQNLGSWVVRLASNTSVPDAPSGFRAFSREAAMQLNVFNSYTYTLETIIQAGQKGMAIASVPVRVNPDLRPSRLVKSTPRYVLRSATTILRIFMLYQPLRFFLLSGSIPFGLGSLLGIRWLIFFAFGSERTRVPSLILAAILILIGVQLWMFGLIADLLAANRRLLEDIQLRMRRQDAIQDRETRSPQPPPQGKPMAPHG
ncbi:glycosyltransferase involved in cell wall biogenesis [Rubidibacter lacunae KORDI 51-2]|uniref:Glycosyltransferase involved in cell wall biogenesis n=1 Tax=Rubidibacter lacunae KORDI 51-2 TaxID=582515 RepID=U5DH36_9CHRO|nr:glycosyltransferase family 2 protein [Rubidibacter lacunae]ERN40567.1 glycosyltransferase involved in cell wall biogenesis [Rubidibacter lacunae KORDI 51-2]